jgi:hypothetical protein
MCEFFENISPEEVAKVLRHSKVNVLLSKGEGANRGIYEGMFCGNVIVVYNRIRGVNLTNINEYTGFTATEENLHEILDYAIKNYKHFDTRGWALSNTGYANATARLNAQLKDISTSKGYNWTCDIVSKKNFPNLMYAKDDDRSEMLTEYLNIRDFLFH